MTETSPPETTDQRRAVILRAALWLGFLAPFFYLTYGTANWLASLRTDVPNLAYGWERVIPFISWTILPYWSINLFYGLCLFINTTPKDVDRLGRRYLTIQLIAVTCFIAFPLKAIFVRPETSGLPGFLFDLLGGFDRPFNQAPSLHIALLVVIWDHLRSRLPGPAKLLWHIWCFLIGASVLTTWQHHLIDIPTGMLLGLFALWLFPDAMPSPLSSLSLTHCPKARRLALFYALGALLFLILSILTVRTSPSGLALLWPALALALITLGYLAAGPAVFQKSAQGKVPLASRLLLAPYRLGVRVNTFVWTRNLPASVEIADSVFLGRFPTRSEAARFATIIDMTGELPAPRHANWHSVPTLDLLPLAPAAMLAAANRIEAARQQGPVLVCCALGFQRSATVIACWLLMTGRAKTGEQAIDLLAKAGRRVHIDPEQLAFQLEGKA